MVLRTEIKSKSLNFASESRQRQPPVKPVTLSPRSAQPISTTQPLELEPPAKTNPNTAPTLDAPKRTPPTPNLYDTTATRTLELDTRPTRNSVSCSQDGTFRAVRAYKVDEPSRAPNEPSKPPVMPERPVPQVLKSARISQATRHSSIFRRSTNHIRPHRMQRPALVWHNTQNACKTVKHLVCSVQPNDEPLSFGPQIQHECRFYTDRSMVLIKLDFSRPQKP